MKGPTVFFIGIALMLACLIGWPLTFADIQPTTSLLCFGPLGFAGFVVTVTGGVLWAQRR